MKRDEQIKGKLMDLAKALQAGTLDAGWLSDMAAKSRSVAGYNISEVMKRA